MVEESACSAGDPGLIPGSGRSPGEGKGYSLQYSCLEDSIDREAWQGPRGRRVGHDWATNTFTIFIRSFLQRGCRGKTSSTQGFPTSVLLAFSVGYLLVIVGCPVHFIVFSIIPLPAGRQKHRSLVWQPKGVSRHCRVSPWGLDPLWWRTTALPISGKYVSVDKASVCVHRGQPP